MRILRQAEYNVLQETPEQFDHIVQVLLEDSEASRDAAYTLGRLGDMRAIPYLMQVIKNDRRASIEAIRTLGIIGDTRGAVPDLIQIVKFDKPHALIATEVLGQIRDSRALSILLTVVEEERPYSLYCRSGRNQGDQNASDLLIRKLKKVLKFVRKQFNLELFNKKMNLNIYCHLKSLQIYHQILKSLIESWILKDRYC